MSGAFNSFPRVLRPRSVGTIGLFSGVLSAWVIVFLPGGAAGGVSYTFQNLGNFAGTAVNDSGQVTGYSTDQPGYGVNSDSYFYNGSTLVDLTLANGLGGPLGGGPLAINNLGDIAGSYPLNPTPGNSGVMHAYLFSNGTFTDLGSLGGYSTALHLNNGGQAVGASNLTDVETDPYYPVLFSGGKVTQIGTATGEAMGINGTGQVVGFTGNPGTRRAFLYDHGALTDLGTLGGASAEADSINDNGQIVGTSLTSKGLTDVFLYQNGKMNDLGHVTVNGVAIPTYATAINDSGTIVGGYGTTTLTPYVYQGGKFYDLRNLVDPTLGIEWLSVSGINDAGQILAEGNVPTFPASTIDAFLLTPVPEPSSAALFTLASVMVLHRRRRAPTRRHGDSPF